MGSKKHQETTPERLEGSGGSLFYLGKVSNIICQHEDLPSKQG